MIAVDQRDDDEPPEMGVTDSHLPPVSPQVEALLATVARLRSDNEQKAELIEALQRKSLDGDLRPLKQLCQGDDRLYQNALRAAKRPPKALKSVKNGGRVLSKPGWLAAWRLLSGH